MAAGEAVRAQISWNCARGAGSHRARKEPPLSFELDPFRQRAGCADLQPPESALRRASRPSATAFGSARRRGSDLWCARGRAGGRDRVWRSWLAPYARMLRVRPPPPPPAVEDKNHGLVRHLRSKGRWIATQSRDGGSKLQPSKPAIRHAASASGTRARRRSIRNVMPGGIGLRKRLSNSADTKSGAGFWP